MIPDFLSALSDNISSIAYESTSRQSSVDSLSDGGSGLAQLRAALKMVAHKPYGKHTRAINVLSGLLRGKLIEQSFPEYLSDACGMRTAPGMRRARACLHDLLKLDWRSFLVEERRNFEAFRWESTKRPRDSTTFVRGLGSAVASGRVKGTGWRAGSGWETVVGKLYEGILQKMCAGLREEICGVGGPMDGYRDLARYPDLVLRLLTHLNRASDSAPQLAQLTTLCQLPRQDRSRILRLALLASSFPHPGSSRSYLPPSILFGYSFFILLTVSLCRYHAVSIFLQQDSFPVEIYSSLYIPKTQHLADVQQALSERPDYSPLFLPSMPARQMRVSAPHHRKLRLGRSKSPIHLPQLVPRRLHPSTRSKLYKTTPSHRGRSR